MNKKKIKEPIKLREKELRNGNISLYLDSYDNGKRKYEFLHLYLTPEETKEDKKKNENTLRLANAVKAKRIIELQNNKFGFSNAGLNKEADFFVYYDKCSPKNGRTTLNVRKKLTEFVGKEKLPFKFIDENFVLRFLKFLREKKSVGNKRIVPKLLSKNTVLLYFVHFSSILNKAVRDNILDHNPAEKVDPKVKPKGEKSHREFLTEEELVKLAATKTIYKYTSTIFLFSCLTGLRYSDVTSLKWGNLIPTKDGGYRMEITQEKTDTRLEFDLPKSAISLLPKRGCNSKQSTLVFGKKYTPGNVGLQLRKWIADAGIDKHITFHCSRHTFATLMLAKGADLYTVSKLLGHNNISTTQIYAKVVEEAKMKALDLLPSLNTEK